MSLLAQTVDTTENLAHEPSISSISTNARIDYILRFSKQAVLVIEDEGNNTSEIIGQYLSSLSDNQNTAYISVSPKLNNIQIRCRLVEQLFGNMLFDPEKSLAVTVLNLAKEANQAISIVIENTHFLSLQIIHELCQLAELGKKTKTSVDVVMVGLPEAGLILTESKNLFTGTLSILEGTSGQLLNFNSAIFKKSSTWYKLSTPAVWLISTLIVLTGALLTTVELHQRGVFSFSALLTNASEAQKSLSEQTIKTTSNSQVSSIIEEKVINVADVSMNPTFEIAQASSSDVFNALISIKLTNSHQEKEIPPRKKQVLTQDSFVQQKVESLKPSSNTINNQKSIATLPVLNNGIISKGDVQRNANSNSITAKWLQLADDQRVSPEYYINKPKGFVVQYSGFMEYEEYVKFINSNQSLAFNAYFKLLNNRAFLVLTSQVYSSKLAADIALSNQKEILAPAAIWIKPLSSIKNEINEFSSAIN